jgi:hypothetical protein
MIKKQKLFHWGSLIIICFIITAIGCTPAGPKRYQVSGTVTFDGQPVTEGEIRFSPDNTKGNTGPQGYAAIENGKFKTLKETGIITGPMFATVTAVGPAVTDDKNDGSSSRKIIFENWNHSFEMPAKPYVLDLNITKENLKD